MNDLRIARGVKPASRMVVRVSAMAFALGGLLLIATQGAMASVAHPRAFTRMMKAFRTAISHTGRIYVSLATASGHNLNAQDNPQPTLELTAGDPPATSPTTPPTTCQLPPTQ